MQAKLRKRCSGISTHIRHRANAILKLLSGGCFFEVNICRVLGDSPNTSKALQIYSLFPFRCAKLKATISLPLLSSSKTIAFGPRVPISLKFFTFSFKKKN
ncbi:hypothetical protein REPUB_Repub01dG0055700 [Reevesia pubescens]